MKFDDRDLANAFKDRPLKPETLRCLRYMHDIESHTVCYLRGLLLTESRRDPRITTFLTTWAWEEQWHGVALAKVLEAHGEVTSVLARRDFVAVHMTWGALNEWSTQAGYARLAALDGHPVLVELLERISRQESRHIAFYATRRASGWPRARGRRSSYALRSPASGHPSAAASCPRRRRRSSCSTCSAARAATRS